MSNAPLVWIDCEMTGLDLEHDALVEIAVLVTDEQLNVGRTDIVRSAARRSDAVPPL